MAQAGHGGKGRSAESAAPRQGGLGAPAGRPGWAPRQTGPEPDPLRIKSLPPALWGRDGVGGFPGPAGRPPPPSPPPSPPHEGEGGRLPSGVPPGMIAVYRPASSPVTSTGPTDPRRRAR